LRAPFFGGLLLVMLCRGNFYNAACDRLVANFVILSRKTRDQILGVVGGMFHGNHAGTYFGKLSSE